MTIIESHVNDKSEFVVQIMNILRRDKNADFKKDKRHNEEAENQ